MSFFFQPNTIGVILNNILTILSFIMATAAHKSTSIHQKVIHTTPGCSRSEAKHFCKKNIHIRNFINYFHRLMALLEGIY